MRFSDLISLIIDNLSRRKGRVMLTAIGVVIGTAAVVTLVSLGAGLQASATSNLWGVLLTWQVCKLALAIRNTNRVCHLQKTTSKRLHLP